MFQINGYISAPDVYFQFFRTLAEDKRFKNAPVETLRDAAWFEFKIFCSTTGKASLIHPNGNFFEVGPHFLSGFSERRFTHKFFSGHTGLVESETKRSSLLRHYKEGLIATFLERDSVVFGGSLIWALVIATAAMSVIFLVVIASVSVFLAFLFGENQSSGTFNPLHGAILFTGAATLIGLLGYWMFKLFRFRLKLRDPAYDLHGWIGCSVVFDADSVEAFDRELGTADAPLRQLWIASKWLQRKSLRRLMVAKPSLALKCKQSSVEN
ncbi:hypothetical protein [Sedimentitalea sp.]|uniref:hypothetical protein n=1 Tax=Sedimentitalea sp. TaxID=2048915 RepID=UPI0032968DAF